jgi:hypothetical protein
MDYLDERKAIEKAAVEQQKSSGQQEITEG